MTPGVSYGSVSAQATFSNIAGPSVTNYPAANLGNLVDITKVARFTPTAGNVVQIGIVFPAPVTIQFIGLVNHNLPAVASGYRVICYSSTTIGTGEIHNSGAINAWPSSGPVTGYQSIRPYVLPTAMAVGSIRINATVVAGVPNPVEIGAIEVANWWPWTGTAPGKQFGFLNRVGEVALAGGGEDAVDTWIPRIMNGEIPFIDIATAATTGIDFQAYAGLARPFVYVEDYDDPVTWSRRSMLARNVELPPGVGRLYRHDRFQFRFIEHGR